MTPERFARLRAVLDRRQPDLTVLAENVHKPHNIAAILRTCDAVGVMELHAVSPGGEFHRHHMVSGGSRKWVRTRSHADIRVAIGLLRSQGFSVVAAHVAPGARDYRDWDYTKPLALLVGAELEGVSAEAAGAADACISVPMRGLVESLNVSVATAVVLYEAARQREAAGLYEHRRIPDDAYAELLFEWCYPAVARVCRRQGIPYPALDAEGFIARPALAQSLKGARAAGHTRRRTSGAGS
jgi:tRNA (guanosine-2'-O-)-methyltransferase